jgi:hypothetical protein
VLGKQSPRKEFTMLSAECIRELRTQWLPNLTDVGLNRLIELLEQDSPLLIHGSFARALPMGCLATHAAWHHPATAHLSDEAGISWLNQIARLNPATSEVIRSWDSSQSRWQLRREMLAIFRQERASRHENQLRPTCVGVLVKA